MKHTTLKVLILPALLAGCASYPEDTGPPAWFQSVGQMYAGHPVQNIAARYGMPDTQQNFQGETVYSWHANTTRQWRTSPSRSTTTGTVGDSSQWPWTSVPYRETTVTDRYETVDYHCRMDVYVRPDGTVRTLGFFGKMGACEEFNPYR